MSMEKLSALTGKTIKEWYSWLLKNQTGCCSLAYNSDDTYQYYVCMGFHNTTGNEWKIAWKIGRQKHNNIMQTDLDIDFEMPYNEETGDIDDTLIVIDTDTSQLKMKDWNAYAAWMRKTARRVWKDWHN